MRKSSGKRVVLEPRKLFSETRARALARIRGDDRSSVYAIAAPVHIGPNPILPLHYVTTPFELPRILASNRELQ